MDRTVTIREANAGDAEAIQTLVRGIFADYGYVLDVQREDPHLREPAAYFRARGGLCWVARRDARTVGVIAVTIHDHSAELKSLYVDSGERRQGLGRRLVELVIGFARNGDCRLVELWSDTLFTDAHRLYERLGFRRCGLREMQVTNRFSEYRYELDLSEQREAG
ncbi:MAG: GNAT family N-acetyltransferase [Phycisphaerae bacterium]